MSRKTLFAIAAVLSLSVGVLAGCGPKSASSGNEPTTTKANPLAQMISDVKGSLQRAADSSERVSSVAFTMTGTSAGVKVTGGGAVNFKPARAEFTIEGAGEVTTIRLIDTTFYVGISEKDDGELAGKKWLKMDANQAGSSGSELSRQFDDMNPVKQVKTLLAATSATAVGEETVNGVRTVHYKGTMPVETYLQQVNETGRAATQKQLEKANVKEVTSELWVDESFLPHRARAIAGTMADLTFDYRDYNKPVTITAPPAAETTDMREMLAGLTGRN